MTTLGSRLARDSIVGVLVVMAALFWVDGPPSAVAQTTAPDLDITFVYTVTDLFDHSCGATDMEFPAMRQSRFKPDPDRGGGIRP